MPRILKLENCERVRLAIDLVKLKKLDFSEARVNPAVLFSVVHDSSIHQSEKLSRNVKDISQT